MPLYSPVCPSVDGTEQFEQGMAEFFEGNGSGGEVTIPFIWDQALALAHSTFGNLF